MTHRRFAFLSIVAAAQVLMAQRPQASVPFVGCEAGGQVSMEAPKGNAVSVALDQKTADKLAYYKAADGLGLLAPRDWYCAGTVGSGGSQLFVTLRPLDVNKYFSKRRDEALDGPVVAIVERFGSTSGRSDVAEVILGIFPAYKGFVDSVKEMFPGITLHPASFSADKLTNKSKRSVRYTTPAEIDGLGTHWGLKKNATPIEGVVILIDQEWLDVRLLSVRLPDSLSAVVEPIIRQVELDAKQP